VTIGGRPACDLILQGVAEGGPVRKYMRLVVHGNSVFELSCQVAPGNENPDNIRAFLSNFRLQ
jgi:hypothetical protein